jgi:predicted Zn-dependent protease
MVGRHPKNIFLYIGLVLLLALCWTCVTNPVTGKKELMLISEADEIAMGAQIHQGLGIEYGFYNHPRLTAYVRRVGESMLPFVHRPHLKYHFHILDTPVQNAFAAPGGYIYITRGLLAMMNSEAELAAVLGHELAHVNARHSASKLSLNILFGVGLALAGEISEDVKKALPAVQIATALLFLQYSRDDEYQADAIGVSYARQARYNPGALIAFFDSIEELSAMSGGGGLPNFLSTHPLTPKRVEAVKKILQPTDEELKHDEKTYLASINGLDYGPSAQAMRVEKGLLVHPKGGFALKLEAGWQATEQNGLLTLVSGDEKTVLLVRSDPGAQNLSSLHQQHLDPLNPLSIIEQETSRFAGHQAWFTLADKVENGERAYGLQLVSQIRGQKGFGFYMLSEEGNSPVRFNEMQTMVGSLRDIRGSDIPLSRKLVTRAAPQGDQTLQKILQSWKIPGSEHRILAFLNHMKLDQVVPAPRPIKLIR